MAGSKRYFRYIADNGQPYSVILDESNSEATCNGVPLVPNRTAAHQWLPRQIKKRYVLATLDSDSTVKRKFWIGNNTALLEVLSGVYKISAPVGNGSAQDWSLSYYHGERGLHYPLPVDIVAGDTGQTDGDDGRDQA